MATETTTTTCNDLVNAAAIQPMLIACLAEQAVPMAWCREVDIRGQNSNVANVPTPESDFGSADDDGAGVDTEYDATEGTELSNIEFSTGVKQLTCAEYGILMEVTDTLVEDAIGGLDLFGIINSHMARALALAWSDDFCALFPGLTAQVGTTTVDLTIAQLLAAQTGIRTRGTIADDGLVYCLDNEQVLHVETALTATGTSMAVYAAAADRIFGFGPGPNQGMGANRHVLNFRGYPVHATGLTDTVAAAADVAGACFTPWGPANDEYSTFGNAVKRLPRFETQRFAKARGTELVLTMRFGVGELLDASGTEIATDAP
jgi:hypothetical protein